jgi:hypothetical protein
VRVVYWTDVKLLVSVSRPMELLRLLRSEPSSLSWLAFGWLLF